MLLLILTASCVSVTMKDRWSIIDLPPVASYSLTLRAHRRFGQYDPRMNELCKAINNEKLKLVRQPCTFAATGTVQ